jgi:tetratricopeptide (TPR) repeat protein/tRNA A-37 threonylcarbamoyl transferase component Bud32
MIPPDSLLWERWDDVDRLLADALDRPAADQAAFVQHVAAHDAPLRDLVLRLLGRLVSDAGRSTAPPRRMVLAAFADPATELALDDLPSGEQVGSYRVRERLGRGGMATVYAAERADGTYQQRVALKVLRRGIDTEDLVRRFLVERQILSSLSHPNIARLLDGGSTNDGRPYLVMELVTGVPITEWADRQRLDVPSRLRLFVDVADAVHDAHRQLVVHRDIKPSNILVDTNGRVKLLDFGIAKLLTSDADLTEVGARALTPDYASPEQLTGGRVTTATDVYQLGLLLRELLTGVRPVAGDTHPGEPPLRPSRAARIAVKGSPAPAVRAGHRGETPQRLAQRLTGDLDVIVGTALRPEPQDRYASADELGADIRRHLRGLPIAAHPESVAYRAKKFVGRHPLFLPVVTGATLGLALFIGTLARQNQRLERERDVAAAASRRAAETQALFVDLFRSADPFEPANPERGRDITVVEALHLGVERVRSELGEQPELRAALLSTIGAVLARLDQTDEARDVVSEAIALRISTGDSNSSGFADDLAVLGDLLVSNNQADSARTVLGRRLLLEQSRDPVVPDRLGKTLLGLSLAWGEADPMRSAELAEQAVAVLRGVESTEIGSALRLSADAYRRVGRWDESEAAAREALAFFEREEGAHSASTAMAAHTLGQTLGTRGRPGEAAELIRRAIAVFDERLGPGHAYTMSMRNNLAVLLINSESYADAERLYREVLAARIARYGGDHSDIAGTYQNLAVAVAGQERYREADRLTRLAEAMYRRVLPGSYVMAFPMLTRAEILLRGGNPAGAARAASNSAAVLRHKVPAIHPAAIMADCRLGRARAQLGNVVSARVLLDSAVRRLETAEDVRAVHLTECRDALAELNEGAAAAR